MTEYDNEYNNEPTAVTGPTGSPAELVKDDAKNRALRTLLQQLAIDILIAVTLLLEPIVRDADDWSKFEWGVILFALVKTALSVTFAFIMRRFLDKSSFPTPRPPVVNGSVQNPSTTGNVTH